MEITQTKPAYQPIVIKLDTQKEASAFFSIIDKVENYRCNLESEFTLTDTEIKLVIALSNADSNALVF